MITAKSKYLSYFWNCAGKAEIGETDANANHPLLSTICTILFCMGLVAAASFGLSSIEKTINNQPAKLFAVETALAAELKSKAQLAAPADLNASAVAGHATTLNLQFKNTGESNWTKDKTYLKALTNAFKFQHSIWPNPYIAATMREETVSPGGTANFTLILQPPKTVGQYFGEFFLMNNDILMVGGDININLNVINTVGDVENTTLAKIPTPAKNSCTLKLKINNQVPITNNQTCDLALGLPENGPTIRVGLFHTPNPITISNDQGWQIYNSKNLLLATVPAAKQITFSYSIDAGQFYFSFQNKKITSSNNLILKNFNKGIFTIASLIDKNKKPAVNFNRFGGDLEIKFYDKKDRVWVVESLPLENYLTGVKETSDNDPIEYQKSIIIAARTYALYHINKFWGQKNQIFDVYADTRDQVYKGLNNADALPHWPRLVELTKGLISTYDNNVILAYYSARSGGKTTSEEDMPYLQSVDAPYTKSFKKWGHGKGIDMYDARARAEKDNWNYEKILNYYYTNIQLEKIY